VPLALSTGHEVGLGVTALAFIVFALASSFLFPRFRPDYPGHGLLAFLVVCFVFFFGMLTAVEVFGAEETHGSEAAAAETTPEPTATVTTPATTTKATTTQQTTTVSVEVGPKSVDVTETEFKIAAPNKVPTGAIRFEVANDGKIAHDLAIKGTGNKTKEIPAGGTAELEADLKPGKYELYCTVPGHEQAGMKLTITVS
jgi:uncharacterized cupredoxin-like copper-binding protein